MSHQKLEESVYGCSNGVGSNAIKAHLRHLRHLHHPRKKLGSPTIMNVRGVGYRVAEG